MRRTNAIQLVLVAVFLVIVVNQLSKPDRSWLKQDVGRQIDGGDTLEEHGVADVEPKQNHGSEISDKVWVHSDKAAVLYVPATFDEQLRPLVGSVIGNALGLLPLDWSVHLHTHAELSPNLKIRFQQALDSGRFVHRNLKKGSTGKEAYLRGKTWAFTDAAWWTMIPAESVLVMDLTTTLCSSSRHSIDEFLEWDWIGAPWKWAAEGTTFFQGGNGAISIRKKSKILAVLEKHKYEGKGNEDMWFIDKFVKSNAKLSDRDSGKHFSVEEMFYDAPLAISYAIRTVTASQRATILSNCPEGRVIVGYLPGADWLLKPELCKNINEAEPGPPCPYT